MRVVVFAPEGGLKAGKEGAPGAGTDALAVRVGSALEDAGGLETLEVVWAEDPKGLAPALEEATDALILVLAAGSAGVPEGVEEWPGRLPVIAVADEPKAAARAGRASRVERMVDARDLEEKLPAMLGSLAITSLLERTRQLVRSRDDLSAGLARWILRVLQAEPPFVSVGASLGVSRRMVVHRIPTCKLEVL